MCVHNIAFQGRFWPEEFGALGLPNESKELFSFSDGYPKVFDANSPADEATKLPEVRPAVVLRDGAAKPGSCVWPARGRLRPAKHLWWPAAAASQLPARAQPAQPSIPALMAIA